MLENIEILNLSQQEEEGTIYHTKFYTENLLAIGMKKTEILMDKPIHLEL